MISLELALTPQQIVQELDRYIIGQAEAKKNVAIALRNRWRRMSTPLSIQKEIVPNNILMIGATGVGKTEIARRLAKLANAPFVKVEASKFTEVGYVGRDVEGMVRDLAEQAVKMVKAERKEKVQMKAHESVNLLLLDLLIPPVKQGLQDQTLVSKEDEELNSGTRLKFKEMLQEGKLEDKMVEIEVAQSSGAPIGMIGGAVDESTMQGLQDMLGNMMPKKAKKRKMTIAEARKVLLEEETSKLIDMDDVKEEAIHRAEQSGIIFIDEIDKIARGNASGNSSADVSREGVQRDLLPVVEGSAVNTKYGLLNTDHVLFIAAGAFHFSKPSDLIPELQGRFPIRVELNQLTKADFIRILSEPHNALTKQYTALIEAEGVHITFEEKAIDAIADIAFKINQEIENIGARRLHTVISHLLNPYLFDIPDILKPGETLVITEELVYERLSALVKNKDLSRYIL